MNKIDAKNWRDDFIKEFCVEWGAAYHLDDDASPLEIINWIHQLLKQSLEELLSIEPGYDPGELLAEQRLRAHTLLGGKDE